MKMLLTRLGVNSKVVITGDITQIDLPERNQSGLLQALKILTNIEGIQVVHFDKRDILRHKLVRDIVEAYDNFTAEKEKAKQENNAKDNK
jgi:phosphate starvation-inducible protein PhoH and related proteins